MKDNDITKVTMHHPDLGDIDLHPINNEDSSFDFGGGLFKERNNRIADMLESCCEMDEKSKEFCKKLRSSNEFVTIEFT